MKKLNLPVTKESLPEPAPLSMDDYIRFVEMNLKYTLDRKTYEEWKKKEAVTVPFRLKKS